MKATVSTYQEIEASLCRDKRACRRVLDRSPLPIMMTCLETGVFVLVNKAFCDRFGYRRGDLQGAAPAAIGLYADPAGSDRLRRQVCKEGRVSGYEILWRGRRNDLFYCRLDAGAVSFANGDCMLTVATFDSPIPIPKHEIRHPNHEHFGTILETISEGYFEVDLKGDFTFFNNAMITITGYPRDELMGLSYRAYTAPEDADRINKVFSEVFATGSTGEIVDYAIKRKDGSTVMVETSASLLRNPSGRPIGFCGILRDRTERKKAEEAVRQSEESYRQLLELAPDSITVTRADDGRYMQVNDAFCKRTGYKVEEVIGRTIGELHIYKSPTDRRRILDALKRHGRIDGLEVQFQTKEGKVLDDLISMRPFRFRNEDCLLTIATNIGSLKEAQSALRRSEEKYRQILETMEEGYYEIDLKGNFTYFNEATRRLHGYPAEELRGMNYTQYLYPERIERNRQVFSKIYRTGIPVKISNYEIIRKDGSVRMAELSSYPMKNPEGKTIGFWGISRDRTEQMEAELALQKSEEQYRLVVENANDGICITQDGRVKFLNPKTASITGYSEPELHEMPFIDLVHPEDRPVFEKHQRKLEEEQAPEVFSFRMLNKEGDEIWVDLSAISITWEGRPAALNFLRDITLQKRMESLLLQSRKMEAIGTLAGGIAHDFNNLLMGIQGNTSLALMDVDDQHPLYDNLKNIEQYVRAGANLTKQLLGAAKGGKYEVRPTGLNSVVEKSAELFGRTHKEIRIHKKLRADIWTVEVDRGQIEQVLLNLFVNAWHAMHEGGEIYLETRNVYLDEIYVQPYGVQPGKFVKMSVTDTGVGIDPKDQKRVFDPFFTTKGMSRGTGLGLASAYGIITNHGGIITVYSEKGSGTTFNMYLPASDKKVVDYVEPKVDVVSGTETILFVDDEEGIVEVGRMILQKLGYKVISANSGMQAVDLYRRQHAQIDLVLLDMIMPGMSGRETFDQLKAIRPDIKVILSSGYSINGQAKDIIDRGCRGFIQKPFSMQDISAKLRQVLDA